MLSFDPVTEEDEGWYWCGVKRNGVLGEAMAVQLRVAAGELQGRAVPLSPRSLLPGEVSPSPLGCSTAKQKRRHPAASQRCQQRPGLHPLPSVFPSAPFWLPSYKTPGLKLTSFHTHFTFNPLIN